MKKFTLLLSAMLFSVMSFAATVTFSPSDFETVTEAAIKIEAGGVTLSIGKGTITADEFRFFKSQTLTVSSTAGNITSIEFTCTAANKTKYGPGGFGALDGYTYADKVGTWTGSTASVTFSTTNNPVRATQVVVTIDGEGGNTTPDDGGDDVTPDDGGNTTPDDGGDDVTPDDGGDDTPLTSSAATMDVVETAEACTVNGADGVKVGTKSAAGTMTITVPAGAKILSFYAAAWKGEKNLSVSITPAANITPASITLTADEGISNQSPFTLQGNESSYLFTFTLKDITKSTTFTLTAPKRFVVWNATYSADGTAGDDTPDDGGTTTPDTPVTGTAITGLKAADATFVADADYGDYWMFDLYAAIDEEQQTYLSPYLYIETYEANGKTTINGTYTLYYAEYWKNEDEADAVATDVDAEDAVGSLTIKNTDNNGNYSFKGSFTATDGKTYTFDQVVAVTAYEIVGENEEGYPIYEDITLSENGETPDTDDMLTCAEATTIAAAENYEGTEEVTVYGYVVELGQQKVDDKTSRNKQCFYLSDNKDGEKQFMAYWAFVPDFFEVGDKVAVTGILKNYKGTIEIVDGEATLLGGTAVEDVLVGETPVKMIKNGQLMIIRGENTYNVLGAQVK